MKLSFGSVLRSSHSCLRAAAPLMRKTFLTKTFADKESPPAHQIPAAPEVDAPLDPMTCYQCEQTKGGVGCHDIGVCGKNPDVAALQDLLVYQLKGLGPWMLAALDLGVEVSFDTLKFVKGALFSTLTNVNFDEGRFFTYITEVDSLTARIRREVLKADPARAPAPQHLDWVGGGIHPVDFTLSGALRHSGVASTNSFTIGQLILLGYEVNLTHRRRQVASETLFGLQETLLYGLKGYAAYADHAAVYKVSDPVVDRFMFETLAFLCSSDSADASKVLAMCLKLGEINLIAMGMLDKAHTTAFGHPSPAPVRLTPKEGKAIVISGHDLRDLELLLEQTKGTGINVYTHGEMLPAHGYPKLRAYPHLAGNLGDAWYNQRRDFAEICKHGPVLMSTNCIVGQEMSYQDRVFTTGEVGHPGSVHIKNKDFSQVIAMAQALPGFAEDGPEKTVTTGFAHNAVLGHAGPIIEAIEQGKLKHIFLSGGCDGPEKDRQYYSDMADQLPKDTVLLTLGCGKYRFYDKDLGTLADTGLPRLMDMGQCNDAYSAIVVASELAKAFKTDINSLPLSLDISWFEQKAVCVLLTLLHLGVKNIRLGPRLPAFLTKDALDILVKAFDIKPTNTKDVAGSIKAMLAGH